MVKDHRQSLTSLADKVNKVSDKMELLETKCVTLL